MKCCPFDLQCLMLHCLVNLSCPDLNEWGRRCLRSYSGYEKESLEDDDWIYPTNSLHRFFKVTDEMS